MTPNPESQEKLRILIVSPAVNPRFGLEAFYARAFDNLGHDVSLWSAQGEKVSIWQRGANRVRRRLERHLPMGLPPDWEAHNLISRAHDLKPDFVFVIRCERLTPRAIGGLSAASRFGCFNIYPDSPFVLPGGGALRMSEALSQYSAVLTFSKSLVPVFLQLGARRSAWLPFGYDTLVHRRVEPAGFTEPSEVGYFGAWGPIQERWLTTLSDRDLRIYGPGWEHLNNASPLRRCWQPGEGIAEQMAEAISKVSVVVNLIRAEHGCAHSMKTFELPACGALVTVNRTDEQEQFFASGKECLYFDTQDELVEKVDFYLKDGDARRTIQEAAQTAVKPHSYTNRARALLGWIGRNFSGEIMEHGGG